MANKNWQQRGQTLIEAIFAIVIVALTATGVVSLIVASVGTKSKTFDRKTATRLAEKVVENLVVQKDVDTAAFWLLPGVGATDTDFPGYRYTVGYSLPVVNPTYPNCNVGTTNCAEATVTVVWDGSQGNESVTFIRFFSKKE